MAGVLVIENDRYARIDLRALGGHLLGSSLDLTIGPWNLGRRGTRPPIGRGHEVVVIPESEGSLFMNQTGLHSVGNVVVFDAREEMRGKGGGLREYKITPHRESDGRFEIYAQKTWSKWNFRQEAEVFLALTEGLNNNRSKEPEFGIAVQALVPWLEKVSAWEERDIKLGLALVSALASEKQRLTSTT